MKNNTMENLFKTYYNNSATSDLKKAEKEFLCNYIENKLSEDDKEAVYMLIYYYYLEDGGDITNAYPYGSKKNKLRGINIPLTKMPHKLRQILYKFCKVIESNQDGLVVEINIKKKK